MIKPYKHSISSRILFTSILLPLTLQGCSTVGGLLGNDDDYIDYTTDHLKTAPAPEPQLASALPGREFRKRDQMEFDVYASAGLGLSQLQPDTGDADGFSVDDKFGGGGQITLGVDINKHLSLEMHSADLGSAGLAPYGRINYHLNGVSALYYAGGNRHNYGRRGITGYGRIGMAMLENSALGNVSYDRTNDKQVLFGAGLEYNTRIGVGLRAEVIAFDKDAQYGQFGLLYRFGKQKPARVLAVAPAPVAPPVVAEPEFIPEPIVLAKPVLAAAIAPKDEDRDGVFDNSDQCSGTAAYVTVDKNGCALFSGTLEGVNFHSNSARLTNTSTVILEGVSETLMQYPRANILVAAHTDSNGSSEHNQALSEDRARAVVTFLARKGIPYSRMSARAFGERKPTDTNSNAEGRANNRRVELFATQKPAQ